MATTQTVTDWRKEWFEIEDATYLNTAAHAAMPRLTLRAVQNSIEANKFPHHPAEQPSSINGGCGEPIVQLANRNRSNMTSLANQIDYGPVLFALLETIQCQSHSFVPPQPTREQQRE